MMDFAALAAPFPGDAIHWRAQNMKADGSSALALAYIDARDVMDRLDAVCGPANWQDSYTETPKGRLICTLSVRVDGEWIAKSDGAGDTDVEGDKGAISDSLKRTAVKWGIGRYLYSIGDVWAECEPMKDREGNLFKNAKGKPQFKKWTPAGLRTLAGAASKAGPPAAPRTDDASGLITDADAAEIVTLANAAGVSLVDVTKAAGVPSIDKLPVAKLASVKRKLNLSLDAKVQQKEAA